MGTWGLGTFDDDTACDWLEDLHESDPIAFFVECLDLTGLDDLEYLACIGVVCTAEILHALIGEPREGLPELAYQWVESHKGLMVLQLIPEAVAGLRRVIGCDSEMHQLWEDNTEMYEAWIERTGDLIGRLEVTLAKNAS